jgi:CTP:molybdopterin cytidylyltransferase MocA
MPGADERPDLLIFHGRGGASAPERLVDGARRASVRQLLGEAAGLFRRTALVTNDVLLADEAAAADRALVIEHTPDTIDFGQQLRATVARLDSTAVVYIGGGSAPLLDMAGLREITARMAEPGWVVANNYLSSDWVGFRPATALFATAPIRNDNDLAWRLHHDADLQRAPVEQTLASVLDIDTPVDLALLRLAPGVPPLLRAYLAAHAPDLPALAAVEATMADPYQTLIVAGRLNTRVWATVERQVSFRKRLFIEERGGRASGRQERGEVRTLLAVLLREVGPRRFFAILASLGDAAVLDTRPLFAQLAPDLSAADRFAADLLQPELIVNPLAREFTAAARAAPLPVVLGGHALVTGGLWLLADRVKAAKEREHARV